MSEYTNNEYEQEKIRNNEKKKIVVLCKNIIAMDIYWKIKL
jgi:hypothetical protein